MNKIKFFLLSLIALNFLIVLNIKSAEQKTASESLINESHPIHWEIIEKRDIKSIQVALNNGFSINLKYKDGYYNEYTPLIVAIGIKKEPKAEIVEFLLKNKADVNVRFNNNETPLMKAAFYGYTSECPKIVQLLIENGANINAQDDKGNTALHHSIELLYFSYKPEIVKLLLLAGADVNITNATGKTFLDIISKPITFDANMERNRKLVLEEYYEFIEKKLLKRKLFEGIENNNFVSVFKILYDNPQMINEKNEIGETILSQAILFGRYAIIKEFFESTMLKIKPNLLFGRISKDLFDQTNPVEYSQQLGRPGCDPAKKIYRDIASYLKKQRDLQEIQEELSNKK